MAIIKAFVGEGMIESKLSADEITAKLDEIIYQDRFGRDLDRNIIVDQPFVGKKSNMHYTFRGNKAFLKVLMPHFEMDIKEGAEGSTLLIESYCSHSLHKLVLGIGIGALALLLFLIIAAFSKSFALLAGILVLGVMMADLVMAYVVGFFLIRYYLQNEYKKAFALIKKQLETI